jgi:hypothetical protein
VPSWVVIVFTKWFSWSLVDKKPAGSLKNPPGAAVDTGNTQVLEHVTLAAAGPRRGASTLTLPVSHYADKLR